MTDGPLNPVTGLRVSGKISHTHTKPGQEKVKDDDGKVEEKTVDQAQTFNGSDVHAGFTVGSNSTLTLDSAHNQGDATVDGTNYSFNIGGLAQIAPVFGVKLDFNYGVGDGDRTNPDGTITQDAYKADIWQFAGGFVGKYGKFGYALVGDYAESAKGTTTDWNVNPKISYAFDSLTLYLKGVFSGVGLSDVKRPEVGLDNNNVLCDTGECSAGSGTDKQGFYAKGATLGAAIPLNDAWKVTTEIGGQTQQRALDGDNRSQNVGVGTVSLTGEW